jgi:DNA-binding NarL/FixJ family response regulator
MNTTTSSRTGESWTEEEEQYVLKCLTIGAKREDIARKLNRTSGAILARQRHIARKLVRTGKSIEEVAVITTLSPEVVRASLYASDSSRLSKPNSGNPPTPTKVIENETLLSVAIEIRDLLRQLVNSNVVVPTSDL